MRHGLDAHGEEMKKRKKGKANKAAYLPMTIILGPIIAWRHETDCLKRAMLLSVLGAATNRSANLRRRD